MNWLTPDTCVEQTNKMLQELREVLDFRRAPLGGLMYGFSDSIGINFNGTDRETYFVSKAILGNQLAEYNLIAWTHWAGRITVQVRDYLERNGSYPETLVYGPPGRIAQKPVGPWIRYVFETGQLRNHTFHGHADLPSEAARSVAEANVAKSPPQFGLRDIVDVRDLEQDDRIRGPMQGTYVLTGGPGVGKTTVALHRIAYLLNEQAKTLAHEVPTAPKDFFDTRSMQVIVWKEHLVTYLEKCLADLGLTGVLVRHVEDWVSRSLRTYVQFGNAAPDYRIVGEHDQLEHMKLGGASRGSAEWKGLHEDHLRSFLVERDGNGSLKNTLARSLQQQVDALHEELGSLLKHGNVPFALPDFRRTFVPTASGVESLGLRFSERLKRDAERAKDKANGLSKSTEQGKQREAQKLLGDASVLQRAADAVQKAVSRMHETMRRRDLPALLGEYYGSLEVRASLATCFERAEIDRFQAEVKALIDAKRLSHVDRYYMLWLAHILTKDKRSDAGLAALEQYSHMVVDEAQYYEPIVLRLLIALAKEPLRSMTIVGDLEQKVTSKGGLLDWDAAGIAVTSDRMFRLTTNYRWTREVFAFLKAFREQAGILESLREPHTWPNTGGSNPEIVRHSSEESEDSWLVDRVVQARRTDQSIAIVVPAAAHRPRWSSIVKRLASFDVRSRWADGEDVKECAEKVIITDYESVVGLEFDAVFLPSFDQVLTVSSPNGPSNTGAAWVAMTRAKKLLAISHIQEVGVLSASAFDSYRASMA